MSTQQFHSHRLVAAASALVLSTAAWGDGTTTGKGELRDLAAQWWQWALSIPAPVSPLLDDTTGANCMVGQRGPNWFLSGTFGGGTVSRTCSVPQGVTLFFPVVNAINFDTPGVCGQVGSLSVAELRGFSADFINSIDKVTATLDSKTVRPIQRVRSVVFAVALPEENIFDSDACSVPSKIYPRAVDDGYYVMVDDLGVGQHVLQFTAKGAGFDLNVTYNLWVVAKDR